MDESICELADLIIKKEGSTLDREALAQIIQKLFDEELLLIDTIFL
jgi:hypothetical protein